MKRGTPRHPKFKELQEILKMPSYACIGILEAMWHFTAEFAPQGDIGRFSDKRIEAAIGWGGRTGKVVEALLAAGWLDASGGWRLVVHGWSEHADGVTRRRLERAGLSFVTDQSVRDKLTEIRTSLTSSMFSEVRPALPNLTKPDLTKPVAREFSFNTFWEKYPRKVGREQALHAWCFCVDAENEPKVMAALDRYLESAEVFRGVVMSAEKWLNSQAADGWAGMWPIHGKPTVPEKPYVAKNEWTEV